MFEVWVDAGLIAKRDMINFELIIGKFVVPSDVGRIPLSIGFGFGGFTANQWSSGITLFSPVLLKVVFPLVYLQQGGPPCCYSS